MQCVKALLVLPYPPPPFLHSQIMSGLHDHAPAHSYAQTASLVCAAYGLPITALFESFECEPLASGSVAQVHRAVLREELAPLHPDGATSRLVAVKVDAAVCCVMRCGMLCIPHKW